MLTRINLLGALTAIGLYSLYIVMFGLRLLGQPKLGHWIAALQFLSALPLIYLLITAQKNHRTGLYVLQVVLFLSFLLLELVIDYLWPVDFRHTRWMVIAYVTYFFAATGGLLGLVSQMTNKTWSITGIALFLAMAALAFISRAVTGI